MPRRRDPSLLRMMDKVKTAGADVIAGGDTSAPSGALALELPPVDPLVAPLVYTPPLQIIAHRVGVRLGRHIDRPRDLKKVVGEA